MLHMHCMTTYVRMVFNFMLVMVIDVAAEQYSDSPYGDRIVVSVSFTITSTAY